MQSRSGGGWDGDCCHFGSRPICNSLHHPPTQLFLVQISHSLTTLRLFVCSRAFPSGRAGRCQRHGGHRKARLCDIGRLSSSTSVTSPLACLPHACAYSWLLAPIHPPLLVCTVMRFLFTRAVLAASLSLASRLHVAITAFGAPADWIHECNFLWHSIGSNAVCIP